MLPEEVASHLLEFMPPEDMARLSVCDGAWHAAVEAQFSYACHKQFMCLARPLPHGWLLECPRTCACGCGSTLESFCYRAEDLSPLARTRPGVH